MMSPKDKDKLLRIVRIKNYHISRNESIHTAIVVDVQPHTLRVMVRIGDKHLGDKREIRSYIVPKSCIELYGDKIEGTIEELLTHSELFFRTIGLEVVRHLLDNNNA